MKEIGIFVSTMSKLHINEENKQQRIRYTPRQNNNLEDLPTCSGPLERRYLIKVEAVKKLNFNPIVVSIIFIEFQTLEIRLINAIDYKEHPTKFISTKTTLEENIVLKR